MIPVVLCKVSQPSRKEPKSYDGKFVTAKCSGINYGATLSFAGCEVKLRRRRRRGQRKRHYFKKVVLLLQSFLISTRLNSLSHNSDQHQIFLSNINSL